MADRAALSAARAFSSDPWPPREPDAPPVTAPDQPRRPSRTPDDVVHAEPERPVTRPVDVPATREVRARLIRPEELNLQARLDALPGPAADPDLDALADSLVFAARTLGAALVLGGAATVFLASAAALLG